MKKIFLTLGAALALAACQKEQQFVPETPDVPDVPEKGETILNFTSDRPGMENDTKTAWDSENSAIVWTSGDRIRVGYTLDGQWMAASGPADLSSNPKVPAVLYSSNNVSIDPTDANIGTFSVPTDFTNSPEGSAVFYAVYPSSATGSSASFAPSLTVTVPAYQTPGAATFDKAADIMYGRTDPVVLSGSFPSEPLGLAWDRVVAHADLTFTNLAIVDDEAVDRIILTFNNEAKVAGTIYLNVDTGVVTTPGGSTNQVTIAGTHLSINAGSIEAWACVLPATFTSLDVTVKTDVASYTRSITGISKTFKKNARNTLTINMASAVRTDLSNQIEDGNYVLAVYSGGTYYAISSEPNGKSARRDRSAISTPGFNPEDYSIWSRYTADDNLVWTVAKSGVGVKIHLAGDFEKYMQYGENTIPLGSTGAVFGVEEGTVDGTFRLSNNNRYISMNGSYGFGCYQSGFSSVKDLYLIPASKATPSTATAVVTTADASAVQITTATISGSYEDASGMVAEVGFYWGTDPANLDEELYVDSGSGVNGVFSKTLTGLTEETTYYYKAYVLEYNETTLQYEYRYGSVESFTTLPLSSMDLIYLNCLEVPAITNLSGTGATGTNADRDDNWYRFNTTDANRQIITHTYTHPETSKQQRNLTILYDGSKYAPVWAAHAMNKGMLPDNNVGRNDSWTDDPGISLPQQPGLDNATTVGYSRGHLVASNYRQATIKQNKQTFYHTNQAPQWQDSFNSGVWNSLEAAVVSHTPAAGTRDTLYVVTGVLYDYIGAAPTLPAAGGTLDVPIPSHFYKCLMMCSFNGSGDMVSASGCAYLFTNEAHVGAAYSDGLTTIDAVETLAGFDFFHNVPSALQSAAEAQTSALW